MKMLAGLRRSGSSTAASAKERASALLELQMAVGARPVNRGHRALALLADALEEERDETAGTSARVLSRTAWAAFCADGDAMADLPLPAAEFEAWASRVTECARSEIERGAGDDAIALLRREWGCAVPLALQTHARAELAEAVEERSPRSNDAALQRAREARSGRAGPPKPRAASPPTDENPFLS